MTKQKLKQKALSTLALLLLMVQGAWGWDGSGTSSDPYLIKAESDWDSLASSSTSQTYSGVYFRQTANISGVATMVGTDTSPFAGIYDGDGHTLNVNLDSDGAFTAPFHHIGGATIRHLHVTGTVTGKLHTAGLVGGCNGQGTNTISDCQVSATIKEKRNSLLRAGGFIGHGSVAKNVLSDCLFDGKLTVEWHVDDSYAGAFIGWSTFTNKERQSITNCMEKGTDEGYSHYMLYFAYSESNSSALNEITLDRCYWTGFLSKAQGTFVFDSVNLPAGCTYKFVSDPTVQFGGKSYWTSGATIDITVPEGTPFDHWGSGVYPGIFISDCFKASGKHQLQDVMGIPTLNIQTSPIPEAETERTLWGVTYRYLSRRDYHYYFSDETVAAKGWHFENGDVKTDNNNWDDNLLVYNADGDASEITVVTGYDESSYNDDGVQIHNDLVRNIRAHTHLGMIAPRAFNNSSQLRTLYFKDTDATFFNSLLPFDFEIGNEAFANCPNLTEIKMMQYTTEGDNHWEGLNASQVTKIGYDIFLASPNAKVSTHRSAYQGYMGSATWKPYRSRIIIYDATVEDFKVNGVKYHKYRNADETKALTNNDKDQMMDNHLRIWNADFQQFSAASLLDTKDGATVYYTYIVGVDDDDIDDADGVMRIYNDPGSYYNYKTLALGRSAIAGNEHVKAIEFYQTNGDSENSYSDLKFVIQNGALKGCKNLKELRLFYYVQDGDDHWETLGPQDVIPGDNIFGMLTPDEIKNMTEEQMSSYVSKPDDIKILVGTHRYQEFLDDPNWQPYLPLLEPVDFVTNGNKEDFTRGGLTYGYMTAPGGIMQTSQVVSQDVSWWTVPRIGIEVAIILATVAGGSTVGTAELGNQAMSQQAVVNSLQATNAKITAVNVLANEAMRTHEPFSLDPVIDFMMSNYAMTKPLWGGSSYVTAGIANPETGMLIEGLSRANLEVFLTYSSEGVNWSMIMLNVNDIQNVVRSALARESKRLLQLQTKLFSHLMKTAAVVTPFASAATTTSSYIASKCWGGPGAYNGDALQKGMRANILSNIHQVGLVGGGYVITTPQKNLIYHNYIKSVDDNVNHAVIYAGFDDDNNSNTSNITTTFAKNAFQNKKNLQLISFHANEGQTSNASMPMLITIPDSAFVGCTGLTALNLILTDNDGGTRALGPENFVLAGDSIFAGLKSQAEVDSLTRIGKGNGLVAFHIVIDENRKQDFLDNESWAPLERFFIYGNAVPDTPLREYGAAYAYAYENNSIKKENKVLGHLIEHTIVAGMDERDYYGFAQRHQGAVKLCNDIGTYNNYQLDYVARKAFYGNNMLRTVSFTDLYGAGAFGDSYTGLDVTLQDSCFAMCPSLVNLDLVYMKTDGTNELQPLTPQQVKVGKGVFDGSPARIKMMPQQVAWFEADSTWAAYKDRFMPCIIRKTDEGVYKALESMRYYDPAATGNDEDYWDGYIDLARIAGAGFSWLDNRFKLRNDIHSFADFKYFESVGLDYVGDQWFYNCTNLSNIVLPSTIKSIGDNSFTNCTSLREIEIPASVTAIRQGAFLGSTSLNTIIVKGETPATLVGLNQFDAHDGLKIYVPATKVQAYKTAWSEFAQYIVSDADYKKVTRITTTGVGQVADLLGLTPVKQNSKIKYLTGNYAKYDSLTVSGPLNGDDIGVLRHLMGANAWESEPTDGQLRYLNLWGATLCKDDDHSYNGYGVDEYLEKDNWVGEYMFHNCTALESVVLPASVTEIGENTFQDATALKRIAVGSNTTKYTRDLLQNLNEIEELVFLTNQYASSESSDPWEANIGMVYVPQSLLDYYLSDPELTYRTQNVINVFDEDAVLWALVDKEHYFPSEYLNLESVNGIFAGNTTIKNFDEFRYFQNVKSLEDGAFRGCTKMERIAIPDSVSYIGSNVFRQCYQLSDIYISSDSVPTIADDAFDFQVDWFKDNFRIYVPKTLCKRYREAWPQYAQYINVDESHYSDDNIITVTVTEPNTLAHALGLTYKWKISGRNLKCITSVRGDYSKYRRLKVVGPISGQDLSILRYLAGFCPWSNTRNYAGHLEYLDLYDADLKASDWDSANDCYLSLFTHSAWHNKSTAVNNDNEFPTYGLLQAYSLKTLILPKSLTKMGLYGLEECEGLEVLVIGDKMKRFEWSALDDDAMLTRLYILSEEKTEMSDVWWIVRQMDNDYNPTFDAFYVRPSLYNEYLNDANYTQNMQRTNLISVGEFDEDESFCAFASHGAATRDDLFNVKDVTGWFNQHPGIKNLTPLGYTIVSKMKRADFEPLTKLEKIVLPVALEEIEDSLFSKAANLRYVDMLMCDSTDIIANVKKHGLARLGIDSLRTLVYLPDTYGTSNGTNIVTGDIGSLRAQAFRLVDSLDYCVPYDFETSKVENSRVLPAKDGIYTICLPYALGVNTGIKAYEPEGREGNTLTFKQVLGQLEALKPYLIVPKVAGATLPSTISQTIPASGAGTMPERANLPGYAMHGTLSAIDNATAHELGAWIMQKDNKWHPVPSGVAQAYIPPFRCYLLESAGAGVNVLDMTLVDDTDGIYEIRTVDADGTERYYDLEGRPLNGKPERGVYILNGKKHVTH